VTLAALGPWEPGPAEQDVVLRSAAEHRARAAGATLALRGPWSVAVSVPGEEGYLATVAFADASHVAKLEVRGGEAPVDAEDREVLTVGPGRWIVLCRWEDRAALAEELRAGARRLVLDMTAAWTAIVLAGPEAERLLRRLGPVAAVPGAGPVAGVPGRVVRRHTALWVLVAAEYAQHAWDVCADLARPLEGGPAGVDAVVAVGRATGDPLLVSS
jgi:heterotetrameric sarcosine oxidase gamma subunit